jgi:hypothetical protein
LKFHAHFHFYRYSGSVIKNGAEFSAIVATISFSGSVIKNDGEFSAIIATQRRSVGLQIEQEGKRTESVGEGESPVYTRTPSTDAFLDGLDGAAEEDRYAKITSSIYAFLDGLDGAAEEDRYAMLGQRVHCDFPLRS